MLNHRARATRTEQSLCRGRRKGKRAREGEIEGGREEDGGASRRCLLIGMERAAAGSRPQKGTDTQTDRGPNRVLTTGGPKMRLDEPAEGSSLAG